MNSSVFLVAGDASGDLHAAEFVEHLRKRRPGTRFVGMGGPEMEKVGVDVAVPQSELAAAGIVEVAASLGRIVKAWRKLGRRLEMEDPDLVVLLDASGFNLPFARRTRRRTRARILYYIPPQVWAWRSGRAAKVARRVDRVAAIFPFEAKAFQEAGARVDFVGHPLVDRLSTLRERVDRARARAALDLPTDRPLVALLPGSRRNEVSQHLPLQLATAFQLHVRDPSIGFVLALASSISAEQVGRVILRAGLPSMLSVEIRSGRAHQVLRAADVALLKPGTSTLEAALLECPMVVMGRVDPVSAAVARSLIRVPFWAMPNLVAGRALVPEFLQNQAQPEALANAVSELLEGDARERQIIGLREVCQSLGGGGAAGRVAAIACDLLAPAAP